MKKLSLFLLLILLVITSCSKKELDMRVQLVDGVISFLEEKGFTCDTTTNEVTNEKYISLSQKELYLHYFPEHKESYEYAVNEILDAHRAKWHNDKAVLPLRDLDPTFYEKVISLADSIKAFIIQSTSLEPNRSFPNPDVYGYRWMYDSLQCELSVSYLISGCDDISMSIALTNDRIDESDIVEHHTTSQDQCVLLLKKLYEDYVLYSDLEDTRKVEPKPFETVVDEFFTKKAKQKLIDAYADEYDGEIESGGQVGYAI